MFRLTQLVDSFSVMGGLIEQLYPGPLKQLVVYSNDRIRIYSLTVNSLSLLHQIDLVTNIQQIVFLANLDPKNE